MALRNYGQGVQDLREPEASGVRKVFLQLRSSLLALSLLLQTTACPLLAQEQNQPEAASDLNVLMPRFALPAAGSLPAPELLEPASQTPANSTPASPSASANPASANPASANPASANPASANPASASPASASSGPVLKKALESKALPAASSSFATKSQQGVYDAQPKASIAISKPDFQAKPAKPIQMQAEANEIVFANGLKLIIKENHEFPVVSTLVFYRVGSRDEDTGATGLAHMVEHLMFQEVGQFKPGEIGSIIARIGGQFNGYTSDDFTTFFETVPANKLEMALKIESERMAHCKFSEAEVKQEIANIKKEFEAEAKDPAMLLSREIRSLLFMQHPYHNPTLGWKSDLESLNAERARSFYKKFFYPANATLVISGDVNKKQAVDLVNKYFAQIPGENKAASHVTVNEPLPQSQRSVSTKYSGSKEMLQLGYRAPAIDDADAPAMVVLERLLNGGISGRLKSKLIDGKLCSAVQANYEVKREPGLFSITCTALPGTYNAQAKILESLDSLLQQLRDKPVENSELVRAKNQAEFAYFAECDGPYRAGFHLGYFDALHKWQDSLSWVGKLKAVSSADLIRVARKYFNPDSRVVGWIAGTQASKAQPPKQSSLNESSKDKEKSNNAKSMEHLRLTGYKQNDNDPGPNKNKEKKSGMPAVMRDIPNALGSAVTGNLPQAVGSVGSAIFNLPGALGDIGTAVGSTATSLGKQMVQNKATIEFEAPNLSHRISKNGINVIVFESHISPYIQISGSIEAGEAYTKGSKSGLSLLAANLLKQGSTSRNRLLFQSIQDDIGVSANKMLNFESNIETIDFSAGCLRRDFAQELDLLADSLCQPALSDGSLEKARLEALSWLKHNEDFAGKKVNRVLLQSLLDENSPFCPPDPSEKAKNIASASLADLQKFFASHIVPGACTIVIAGDIKPEEAYGWVDKSFANWNGKGAHAQMKARLASKRVLKSTVPLKDSKKSSICFGQIIPINQSHPDYGSLLLADSILVNHPMYSRFEQALSKNPALESAIAAGDMTVKLEPISNLTRWSLSLFIEPNAVPLSVKTIKGELRQLVKNGVGIEEFNEAKRHLLGSLPVRTQSTLSELSESLLTAVEHSNSANSYSNLINSVKNANIESVNRVIRTLFKPNESTIVIAGSADSIKAVRSPADAPETPAQKNTAAASNSNSASNKTAIPAGKNVAAPQKKQ